MVHGNPRQWSMRFSADSSISSRKIITITMRQSLRHFGTKRVHNALRTDLRQSLCAQFSSAQHRKGWLRSHSQGRYLRREGSRKEAEKVQTGMVKYIRQLP